MSTAHIPHISHTTKIDTRPVKFLTEATKTQVPTTSTRASQTTMSSSDASRVTESETEDQEEDDGNMNANEAQMDDNSSAPAKGNTDSDSDFEEFPDTGTTHDSDHANTGPGLSSDEELIRRFLANPALLQQLQLAQVTASATAPAPPTLGLPQPPQTSHEGSPEL